VGVNKKLERIKKEGFNTLNATFFQRQSLRYHPSRCIILFRCFESCPFWRQGNRMNFIEGNRKFSWLAADHSSSELGFEFIALMDQSDTGQAIRQEYDFSYETNTRVLSVQVEMGHPLRKNSTIEVFHHVEITDEINKRQGHF
jgi:hypothetical protein